MNLRIVVGIFLLLPAAYASPEVVGQADALYERTDYTASLNVLNGDKAPDASDYALMGKNYFMLGDYITATRLLEEAVALAPGHSEYQLWLGRAYGRRAETGTWLKAGFNASKARQHFEKAAALDPHNADAVNDLFEYYLNAPPFLGGGVQKAEAIARRIAAERPAESHFELAQIAERRKQYAEAEGQLRRAMEVAPGQVGRVLDLAGFFARHGRIAESDTFFALAVRMAPANPGVLFARAKTYIEQRRNPEQARNLLRQYLASSLTPNDPPRAAAEKLLRQATGG